MPTELLTQREQALEQTIKELADVIRSSDQLVFQMSQCTSWPQMQQYFKKLQEGQQARQRAESNRITEILRRELLQVYTKHPPRP